MPGREPLDADTVHELLQPETDGGDPADWEEDVRSWLTPDQQPPTDLPLLRLWDEKSGSQPDESGRMLARAPRQRLCTLESRRESLEIHVDNGRWVVTPYISFSSLPEAIEDLAQVRDDPKKKRGPHKLIAINPGVREAKGLPVLDVGAEMEHYGIEDPYDDSDYYENHYACLWEVTPEEIVGQWTWKKLMKNNKEDWYKEIVLPAFQQHNNAFTKRSAPTDIGGPDESGRAAGLSRESSIPCWTFGLVARLMVSKLAPMVSKLAHPIHAFCHDADPFGQDRVYRSDEEI
ncbi:hypothetical protein VFPFJ_07320 [Purpureocillium lilacinum]|uniref:Uncharacterized protein n=1 Tax=Purpureocillium lilacinum TaxID=33203 RepID=A0A179HF16_PURLI|nr:hypothetical protein VFPFJ_07320 [Purpureocillium lilacinum]OAQ88855.1 hypothetical protein VFPFJ_07320 [Purpureocillium lilacinum]